MAISFPASTTVPVKRTGLQPWMDRVLELTDQVRHEWDPDDIHDLRVALRRCRTMAEALSQVNPDPGWHKLKKTTRDLFHIMGDLRDVQVERQWAKKIGAPGNSVRGHLLKILARKERSARAETQRALESFDRKNWKKWSRKLPEKSRFFPAESVVFQRLALGRLNEAAELYQRARGGRSRVAWHRLRIALKSFRYVTENFLPQRYDAWRDDLKRVQDLLGDVHDLDVLRGELICHKKELDAPAVEIWKKKIDEERKIRLDEFRGKITDRESLFLVWRSAFGWGHTLQTALASPPKNAAYSAS
ncbi:MAG: CHAD domain-containing protein [Candidatus Acidiferrales bacterium]